MTVHTLPIFPKFRTRDGEIDIEYMRQLIDTLEQAIDTLNVREPLKNNVVENLASGDYLQYDGQTWRNTRFPMGSIYISSSAETTISASSTWTKAAGTTTDVTVNQFDGTTALGVDNRLKYTGTIPTHIHGVVTFSSSTASPNQTMEYGCYYYDDSAASGSVIDHSIVSRRHGSSDIGTGAMHFDVMLETNDYVEFHVRNMTSTANATIENCYIFMMGMG
jgi:hypothetical protein